MLSVTDIFKYLYVKRHVWTLSPVGYTDEYYTITITSKVFVTQSHEEKKNAEKEMQAGSLLTPFA
jgi:hypothetical protein